MTDKSYLTFNSDGNFKIMIITDIQDSLHLSPYTAQLITRALDQEKPDLVVLGGDNICGFAPSLSINPEYVKQSMAAFLSPIKDRSIPFCVVFGNHDTTRVMSKTEQMEYFRSYDNCYAQLGTIGDRVCNYHLLLKDSQEQQFIFNLWFLDSGEYADGKISHGYASATSDQIDWYEETSKELRETQDSAPIPAFLFQHIPIPEIYQVLSLVSKDTPGAIQGHRTYKNQYYVINPECVTAGTMEEAPCPPDKNSGQFESWKNQGDIVAAFFGHDHLNDFDSVYEGIRLVYTPGAGFYSYGKRGGHGVRIIELNENNLPDFTTRMVYFQDLSDQRIPWYLERLGSQILSAGAGILLLFLCIVILICRTVTRHFLATRKK